MKDGGRKRFCFSPSPELKQEFKKSAHNDFVEGRGRELRKRRNLLSDLSEVADVVNVPPLPEVSPKDLELEGDETLNKMNQERRIVIYHAPTDFGNSPDSSDVAGGMEDAGRAKDNIMHQLRSKQDGPPNANGTWVGEIVNLPKMNMEPSLLLESSLEPCHLDKSHDVLVVGEHVRPKNDNILLLAQVNSADMFDTMVAQLLLAGGMPEEVQIVEAATSNPPPATDPTLLALVATNPSPVERASDMDAHFSPPGVRSEVGVLTAEPHPPQMLSLVPAMHDPVAAYVPSFEEFPPLEKGRTLKIRDTFETGMLPWGRLDLVEKHLGWPSTTR